MLLKSVPEDFIVQEILEIEKKAGSFGIYTLEKREITTFAALNYITNYLKVPMRDIGYCGIKDKFAVTTQFVSIKNVHKKNIEHNNFTLTYLQPSPKPLHLGAHQANRFIITARALQNPLTHRNWMPNYFDKQRFSSNNLQIGFALLQKDPQKAIDILLEEGNKQAQMLQDYLDKNKNDYKGALRRIQPKHLSIFVGSVQSKLFNDILSKKIQEVDHWSIQESFGTLAFPKQDDCLIKTSPLPGFTQPDPMMNQYEISPRDFALPYLPHVAAPGGQRDAFVRIQDLELSEYKNSQQTASFVLRTGSYATIALKTMQKT